MQCVVPTEKVLYTRLKKLRSHTSTENPLHSYEVSPATWDQCYLLPKTGKCTPP